MKPLKDNTREYFIVLLLAAILYIVSAAPSIVWQDSGMIQYRLWHNDIEGELGLALAHPLFYMLGIIFRPILPGDIAYNANFLTAIISAFAIANIYLLMKFWLKNSAAAALACASLALSHTFWAHAAMCETYNLYIAILLAELIYLWLFCQNIQKNTKFLYYLAFFNGLAISNHMLGTLPLACYGILILYLLLKKYIKIDHLLLIIAFWIIGASPYLFLIVKDWIIGGNLPATLISAAFGDAWQQDVLNTRITARIALENMLYFFMNFPTPNMILAFVGLWMLKKSSTPKIFTIIIYAMTALFLAFAFRYTVVDRYAFFIPFYTMTAIFIGLGAKYILEKYSKSKLLPWLLAFALLPIFAYSLAPAFARKHYPSLGTARTIPYRDDYKYFLQPWQTRYYGCQRFGIEALQEVEEDAFVYADNTTVYALLYAQQIKNIRPDVRVISSSYSSLGQENLDQWSPKEILAQENIYVVTPQAGYCPAVLLDNFDFEPAGVLYRAIRKAASGPDAPVGIKKE